MRLKKKLNKEYMQVSLYVIFTCIVIYVLSLVAKNITGILGTTFGVLNSLYVIVKPIVVGFIFAYLLNGVVTYFEKRLKKLKWFRKRKSCRGYAVLITVLLIVLVFSVMVSLLIFSITDQLRVANFNDVVTLMNGFSENLNDFIQTITHRLNSWNIQSTEIKQIVSNVSTYLVDFAKNFLSGAVGSVTNLTGTLTTIGFGIIIAIYFLIDGSMIQTYLKKVSQALFSRSFNRKMHIFLNDADTVFSGYMKGQLMDAFVMMILISLTLSIVKVKFGIIIGILAGIGNLIPYCGPFVAYAGSILVCTINGEWTKLLIALVALVVVQAIDGNIIGPKLLSQSIQVHPLLVIISLIFGSAIGGLFGMLLAVPVGALIKVIFNRFIDNRIEMKEQQDQEEEKE